MPFLKFWADCFLEGWHIGHGFFGIIEFVCIFVSAALHWHNRIPFLKKYIEKWKAWEVVVMKWAAAIFAVACLISTILIAQFIKVHEKEENVETLTKTNLSLTSSNSYLQGKIQGQDKTAQVLQKQIEDNKRDQQSELLSLKTDVNEANREKDSALQRLSFFESNPDKLSRIYSNIFAHSPTNFQQYDSMLQQFTTALSNISDITVTAKYLQTNATGISKYSQSELEKLDEKTSDLVRLPDGRTKFGGVITGSQTVVMDAFKSGIHSFTNGDFQTAFGSFQKAITAFESTSSEGATIDTSTSLTRSGKAMLYWYAGVSADKLSSNTTAGEYAEKAIQLETNISTQWLFVSALANRGVANLRSNNFTNAFASFSNAITHYESLDITNQTMDATNSIRMYAMAALSAFRIGNTNEANLYGNKAVKIFQQMMPVSNTH